MQKLRILVVDPIHPGTLKTLKKHFSVTVKKGMTHEELIRTIPPYHALIGRTSTKIDAAVLAAGTHLRCIGVHATGWDHVDVSAATARGIVLLGYPSDKKQILKDRLNGSFIACAEHTILAMLAAAGDFYHMCDTTKKGGWEKYGFAGTELYGKTVGIIGMGRIGSLVAERARAFGMHVIAYGPRTSAVQMKKFGAQKVSLDELLRQSDFITLHVPSTPETHHLINKKTLARMKRGVILINTARAAVIDEAALLDALNRGKVRAAVLDMLAGAPKNTNKKLREHPRVMATPHIAGVGAESLARVSAHIGTLVTNHLLYESMDGAINPNARHV